MFGIKEVTVRNPLLAKFDCENFSFLHHVPMCLPLIPELVTRTQVFISWVFFFYFAFKILQTLPFQHAENKREQKLKTEGKNTRIRKLTRRIWNI